MAKQVNQMDFRKFSCSICLDLLKDPVTIPCGHSYCLNCIKTYWDAEDQRRICSCPQCRKDFIPRPDLVKNTMLADLVEELKETGLGAAPADHCYAGPEDVSCDVCTGRKLKAVKSCLVCLVSYCEKHLQPHHDVAQLKRHKLVEPSRNLQENICPRHDEVMKVFCRTDQQCICYLCLMDEHRGHETVPVSAERAEKQKELEVSRQQIQQRIQDRQKDVELLQQEVEDINISAVITVEESEEIFTQLIRLIKKRRSDVKQQVRSQQETEVRRVKELQEKLEQEITELKRKDGQLEQLSHTEDHKQFLHNYPSVSALSESPHSSSINIRPLRHFEDVTAAVSELRDIIQDVLRDTQADVSLRETEVDGLFSEPEPELRDIIQDILRDTGTNISLRGTEVDGLFSEPEPELRDKLQDNKRTNDSLRTKLNVLLPQPEPRHTEPKTRADFLKYSCKITLDPNTVNRQLLLSDGNRKARFMNRQQVYPAHPDRFTVYQVLSKDSLTGRCYWEVERRGRVFIAVSYKNIRRAGKNNECVFGSTEKSWALHCDTDYYSFCHNELQTPVSGPRSSRIGVYLDHSAGVLSFYSVSETMTLLHRVQTTFTQPLHAGVHLTGFETTAEFIKVRGAQPVERSLSGGYTHCSGSERTPQPSPLHNPYSPPPPVPPHYPLSTTTTTLPPPPSHRHHLLTTPTPPSQLPPTTNASPPPLPPHHPHPSKYHPHSTTPTRPSLPPPPPPPHHRQLLTPEVGRSCQPVHYKSSS